MRHRDPSSSTSLWRTRPVGCATSCKRRRRPFRFSRAVHGAYVGQAFLQEFPSEAMGFVSIDSAPLAAQLLFRWELWLLKRMEPVCRGIRALGF